MNLVENHLKIYKSLPLSGGMAAMHTALSLDKRILQKSSFEELKYNSEHKDFTLLWNYTHKKDTHVGAFASFPASKIFLSSVTM